MIFNLPDTGGDPETPGRSGSLLSMDMDLLTSVNSGRMAAEAFSGYN